MLGSHLSLLNVQIETVGRLDTVCTERLLDEPPGLKSLCIRDSEIRRPKLGSALGASCLASPALSVLVSGLFPAFSWVTSAAFPGLEHSQAGQKGSKGVSFGTACEDVKDLGRGRGCEEHVPVSPPGLCKERWATGTQVPDTCEETWSLAPSQAG